MSLLQRYHLRFAAAFVRGTLVPEDSNAHLFSAPLSDLNPEELSALFELGKRHGLRLHPFKRSMGLARVNKAIGYLHGLRPDTLLDVGTGRGAFLWPCLEAFPQLRITCIDLLERPIAELQAVARGGVERLRAEQIDVGDLGRFGETFDGVTLLETLEHIPDPARAAREVVRAAKRFVVASVPSKDDDNPEHIHLFSRDDLKALFLDAGAERVTFDAVLNHHLIVVLT